MLPSTAVRGAALAAMAVFGACARAPAPPRAAPWTDRSPHHVTFVAVAPDVRLEVLDWGGSGPPLVFLSGLDDVAHGFDDFAPRFTDHFHVLAITRRGYGASSQPATGYDLATRVADLAAALDSLHLGPVILVGHSIAGDELTAFAAAYPSRVTKLVYFDAAYDHSGIERLLAGYPQPPPMTAADSASPAAVQAYQLATMGVRIPEAQIRATEVFDSTGRLVRNVTPDSIDAAILRGTGHPDYAAVRAPALAFYAVPDSAPASFPYWGMMDDSTRAAARAWMGKFEAWGARERARFRHAMRHPTIVLLHGANHYVFFSDRDAVEARMRAFLESGDARRGRRG
jgi:pimeloyl-ACP methyl ester carboxylesterase